MDRQKIVLIVDDTPENIDMLINILYDEYKVKAATSGSVALNIANKSPQPDIILLDIMMPGMDGYEVCKRLKEDPETADIPVIFITAMSDENDEKKGLELGAVDYITKPISPFITKARIETHLALYEKEQYLKERIQQETEKRIATEKLLLRQSRLAAMGEMLSAITHQWRQPLSVLATVSATMRLDAETENLSQESVSHQLDDMDTTLDFMQQTMYDFKNYFKADKEKKDFSVKEAVENVTTMLSAALKNNNIMCELQADDNVDAYGISSELKQVILNLISNAKDAIKERAQTFDTYQGKIAISVRKEGTKGIIEVSDNGGGIPQESMGKIFDDYYSTKEEKGTGIGLSMSKMIIEDQFLGTIDVENTDEGAKFTVVIGTQQQEKEMDFEEKKLIEVE